MEFESLTGPEKVAIVILSMPEDLTREFLSQLDDDEVEKALAAVSRMDEVPPRVKKLVVQEFQESLGTDEQESVRGGRKEALMLADQLETARAARVREHLGRDEKRIDWTLRSYQSDFIAERIQNEHPQSVALLLSQLPADRGAKIIEALPEQMRSDVVLRVACMEPVSTEVIAELELGVSELFERKSVATARVGGASVAAGMLNRVPKEDGASILEDVDAKDAEMARSIRKRMLTFDDLIHVDRRGFQALLREVPTENLAVALKNASDEMRERVYSNLSSRAAEQIKEEGDLLGPMRLGDVEAVQEEIIETARNLEAEGRLSIEVGGGDEIMV